MASGGSCTEALVDFIVRTDYGHLPDEVRTEAKRLFLDTLGCGVGGYSLERGKIVAAVAREQGGRPESTILAAGDRVSSANAAFANGDLCNALDADDTFQNMGHLVTPPVCAALAMAERSHSSGRELLAAAELGIEVNLRLSLSMSVLQVEGAPLAQTYNPSSTLGFGWLSVGAAASAGKILGFGQDKMADAIGLAGANAPSSSTTKMSDAPSWSMMKYTHYGFTTYVGVLSALLAASGYTGERTILDGDVGLWRFCGALAPEWENLTGGLGERWWILEESIKPYPSCRYTHHSLDLFYKVRDEYAIRAEEIDGVTIRLNHLMYGMNAKREGLALDVADPLAPLNSQFSLGHLVAVAALGYTPGPEWHSAEALRDPRVSALRRKVKVEISEESNAVVAKEISESPLHRWKRCPTSVVVRARGKAFEAASDYAKGDPWTAETRLSDAEVQQKFRNFCAKALPPDRIEAAIEAVFALEDIDDVSKLARLLAS